MIAALFVAPDGGRDSRPRIGTPPEFRDILMAMVSE